MIGGVKFMGTSRLGANCLLVPLSLLKPRTAQRFVHRDLERVAD